MIFITNLFICRRDENWSSCESRVSEVTERTDDRKPLAKPKNKGQKVQQNGKIRHHYKSGDSHEGWCSCQTFRVS